MGEARLELEVAEQDGWQVLIIRGEVDVTTTPRVRARLVAMLSDGGPRVIVDLEGVRFLDSSGLGALVAALKLARGQGGELRLVCEHQRSVKKVLSVTGLDRVLDRFESVDAAVAA